MGQYPKENGFEQRQTCDDQSSGPAWVSYQHPGKKTRREGKAEREERKEMKREGRKRKGQEGKGGRWEGREKEKGMGGTWGWKGHTYILTPGTHLLDRRAKEGSGRKLRLTNKHYGGCSVGLWITQSVGKARGE